MRAGIGLLALLMGVALMFYLMSRDAGTSLAVKKQADQVGNQISGKDANGKLATDTLTFDADAKGVKVNTVEPGGAFEQKFGIKAGDLIVEIGPLSRDQFQDNSTAKAYLHDAYARDEQLVVVRGNERLTLPQAGTPAAGRPTAQQQVQDLMNKVQTH